MNYTTMHGTGSIQKLWLPGGVRYYAKLQAPTQTAFKICLVPGLTSININCGVGQASGAYAYFAARMGKEPVARPAASDSKNGFTVEELLAGDCIGQNSGGYLMISKQSQVNIKEPQWLYFNITTNVNIIDCTATLTPDAAKYTAWYNSAKWLPNGDPVVGAAPIPIPPPIVPPPIVPPPVTPPEKVIEIKIVKGQLYRFTW